MSEEYIIEGYPDSPYYQDKEANTAIDRVLKECAALYAAKGQRQLAIDGDGYKWVRDIKNYTPSKYKLADELPEQEAKEWYATQEARLLSSVLHLDEDYVSNLYPDEL